MAANPNTNFTAGQILTADQANRWPRGVVGYVQKATTQAVTADADLGMGITFTAEAGRIYKFSITIVTNATATPTPQSILRLWDGAAEVETSIQSIPGNGWQTRTLAFFVTGITAGSKTYSWRASSDAGSVSFYGNNTAASIGGHAMIEDMGPA
jgi:hypothetical protein